MKEVTISEFRAKLFALIRRVEKTKKPLRVTRFGKPLADIIPVPVPAARHAPKNWMGSMRGTTKILGDIVSPATDPDEWGALRD